MIKGEDLTGRRFGMLTVAGRERSPNDRSRWLCNCDCGCRIITRGDLLRRGGARSCGCTRKPHNNRTVVKHGLHNTRIYTIWANIKARCNNPKSKAYPAYGGRGIKMCDEWAKDFREFFKAVGHPPEGRSLERIDNDKGYFPGNMRWATAKDQARNRRSTRLVNIDGNNISLAEAAESASIPYSTAISRLDRGWSIERALSTSEKH